MSELLLSCLQLEQFHSAISHMTAPNDPLKLVLIYFSIRFIQLTILSKATYNKHVQAKKCKNHASPSTSSNTLIYTDQA